jgi:hypothetical protein
MDGELPSHTPPDRTHVLRQHPPARRPRIGLP